MSLTLGKRTSLRGLCAKSNDLDDFRSLMWKYLCNKFGNYEFLIVSDPFSINKSSMLVLTNEETEIQGKGPYVIAEGIVDDFYRYSPFSGRFVICDRLERFQFEKIYEWDKPLLSSERFEALFWGDIFQEALMNFTVSSPPYMDRAGGNSLSVFTTEKKDYADISKLNNTITEYLSNIHPLLKSSYISISAHYELPIQTRGRIKINSPIAIKRLAPERASDYLLRRKGHYELSVLTSFEISDTALRNAEKFYGSQYNRLISFSELPIIPYHEELWLPEIGEYSLDIAYFVMYNHFRVPTEIIPKEFFEKAISRILKYIDDYLPLLREAMNYGMVVDVSRVGGIWEHLSRLSHSFIRVGYDVERAISKSIEIYIDLIERTYDCLEKTIKTFLSTVSEKKKIEKAVDRVLFELSIYRPEGWSYSEYEERMALRGFEPNVSEKILRELLFSGRIYEVSMNRYKVA